MALHIKKNDEVVVTSGDHKGARGKVVAVLAKSSRAVVAGVNIGVKHTKDGSGVEGGRVQREFPIHISNLSKA
jgi:large subunit ribosomal protein L24